VLDEADRMLDLGFRDDLLAIFGMLPKERRTHLVSATFPRMVRALADKVQNEPAHVEGTRLGAANVDIDHVIHVVDPHQRLDALINLLLANPDDQTLVFVRTRADAAHIANELVMSGFAASGLSGEMDQAARNRALTAFRQGGLRVLIATDVAARGIDVQNVSRVVHAELPTNADAYTHRSGRTGRAGRKGTSSLLIAPAAVVRATRLLRGLGVQHRVEAIPSAAQINAAGDRRLLNALTAEPGAPQEGDEVAESTRQDDSKLERWQPLAAKLIAAGEIERTLTRLLARMGAGITEPRNVRVFAERPRREALPPRPPARGPNGELRQRNRGDSPREGGRRDYEPRASGGEHRSYEPRTGAGGEPQGDQEQRGPRRYARDDSAPQPRANGREAAGGGAANGSGEGGFTRFRVSWGRQRGADARRLLAMVCRRGQIRGRDVGAIRVEAISSIVEVADAVAADFARAAGVPDPREPNVVIRRAGAGEAVEETREASSDERHVRTSAPRPRKAGGAKSLQRRPPNR
jgi:ATP-dependent RNA helicase DeaD